MELFDKYSLLWPYLGKVQKTIFDRFAVATAMGSTVGIFTESLEKYFNRSVAIAMEFTVAIFLWWTAMGHIE